VSTRPVNLVPFKVFGLQRTGTNLIHALMLENFSVRYLTEARNFAKNSLELLTGRHHGLVDAQTVRRHIILKAHVLSPTPMKRFGWLGIATFQLPPGFYPTGNRRRRRQRFGRAPAAALYRRYYV